MTESAQYSVLCHFEAIGFHCWPQAPSERAYLRNDHRHLFKFRVELEVEGTEREIEVHTLKESCLEWAAQMFKRASTYSCEKFSKLLLENLYIRFQPSSGRVECWEDGECGGACEMSWKGSE